MDRFFCVVKNRRDTIHCVSISEIFERRIFFPLSAQRREGGPAKRRPGESPPRDMNADILPIIT